MKLKKIMGILLTATMVASLTACGGGNESVSSTENENQAETEESTEATESEDTASEEGEASIDMEGDPYTVAIQVVTLPGTELTNEEAIESAINEITVPAINCQVDIQNDWISEVANKTSMGAASGEKFDLIHVATVQQIGALSGQGILYDMNADNLLETHGQALLETVGQFKEAGEVNGEQLAIPAEVYTARGFGFYYNKDVADESGVELGETTTLDDLESALYKIKESKPDMMPYYVGSGENLLLGYLTSYEAYGTNASYGVILDSASDTTVVNLYATDLFKDYAKRMLSWKQNGLMTGDTTDTNTNQAYFSANNLFAVPCEVTPNAKATNGASYPDINLGWSMTGKPQVNFPTVTGYMWGISANSERPDKAMDFLNYAYENEEVGNLLRYGIEGENYDKVEGSQNTIESNGTYPANFMRIGNTAEMYAQSPATDEMSAQNEEFQASATVSPLVGYMFDSTDYQTETAAITSTITEYLPRIQSGAAADEAELEALLEEFNSKLEASGINDVIAANQEQLNAYLSK